MLRRLEPLPREFYSRPSPDVARDLVGKKFVRLLERGTRLEGTIVETEAYGGSGDPASHAFRGKTPRNSVMFGEPGHVYVYFTYGFHYCANLVTGRSSGEAAGAVLVRSIQPTKGIEMMQKLRGTEELTNLASGPGKVCKAFSIDKKLNGADVTSKVSRIWVESRDGSEELYVGTSSRVGIRVGIEKPWRFFAVGNTFVSKKRPVVSEEPN